MQQSFMTVIFATAIAFCWSPSTSSAQTAVRRDITSLSAAELTAYRDAFRELQNNGEYARLAGHHGCPDYFCHRDPSIFLPWHRAYIRRFEQALQQIDSSQALHYWDWTSEAAIQSGIPSAFTDQQYQSGGATFDNPLRRFRYRCGGRDRDTRRSPDPPFLLRGLRDLINADYLLTSYAAFNGMQGVQGPHGSLHGWVGEEMADTEFAAYDPLFWAHHATVDRQWARWQESANGQDPSSAIMQRQLPPFNLRVSEVIDYRGLGYEYDHLQEPLMASFPDEESNSIPITNLVFPAENESLMLFVVGLPQHPRNSFRVYAFVNQPDATLDDVTPDNPNFAGFFGIFGGRQKHLDEHRHEKRRGAAVPAPTEEMPVVNLTPTLMRVLPAQTKAAPVSFSLDFLVTDAEGELLPLSDLPFSRISLRTERNVPVNHAGTKRAEEEDSE